MSDNITPDVASRCCEGAALGNLGNVYHSFGDYPKAMGYHEQRLTIAREMGDRLGEGHSLYNMSLSQNEQGDRAAAIVRAAEALTVLDQMGAPEVEMVRRQLNEWRGKE